MCQLKKQTVCCTLKFYFFNVFFFLTVKSYILLLNLICFPLNWQDNNFLKCFYIFIDSKIILNVNKIFKNVFFVHFFSLLSGFFFFFFLLVDNRRWHMPICEMNTNHPVKWNITFHYGFGIKLFDRPSIHLSVGFMIFVPFFGFLEFLHENGRVSSTKKKTTKSWNQKQTT